MPSTPKEHFEYTYKEWKNDPFIELTKAMPETLDVIYDIGANAGGFTQVMKDKYPNADIYCFEPVKETFNFLKDAVPYAICFKKGIYYGQKTSRALWRGGNIGAIFIEHINAGEPRIHKDGEILELDELESFEIPKPDLVKMDVEGAEENIIEHSKIVKESPWLIIEWHPDNLPIEFFKSHLPYHEIVVNLSNKQFLLCRK